MDIIKKPVLFIQKLCVKTQNILKSIESFQNYAIDKLSNIRLFGSFQLWTSLLFVTIAYLPFIKSGFGERAGFIMLGDVINLWVPQIYQTILHNKQLIFDGTDLLTQGGASEYFMRPNIFTHSPIIFIMSFFVRIESLAGLFRFVFFLYILHSFLSCYFLQKLAIKFFKFDKYLALFLALGFTFSITSTRSFGFTPFLFTAMLLPMLIHASLSFVSENITFRRLIIYSFPAFIMLLSGYINFSVLSIVLTAIFSCTYFLYINPYSENKKGSFKIFVKSMWPIALAGLLVLPLYYAQMQYHINVSTAGAGGLPLHHVAHQFALIPSEFFGIITGSISYQAFYLEQQIIWGVIPIMIFMLYIVIAPLKKDLKSMDYKLLFTSAVLYFGFMFCLFGTNLVTSDLFYHTVPAIGKMHFYQRYLVIFNIFFILTASVVLKLLLIERHNIKPKILKTTFFIALVVTIILTHLVYYTMDNTKVIVNSDRVLMEFILACFFMVTLLFCKARTAIMTATIFIFFVNIGSIYDFHRNNWWELENQKKQSIIYDNAKESELITYFKRNSKKDIIKYIDTIPEIHAAYVPKNYPWFIKDKIALSSYFGYDAHFAADAKYAQRFQSSRDENTAVILGKFDWNWLRKTGAEFIIFHEKDLINNPEFGKHIDRDNGNVLNLSEDLMVSKLKFQKEDSPSQKAFDNGYIKADSDSNFVVKDFKTDSSKTINFKIKSTGDAKITYLFWPNPRLRAYVDNKEVELKVVDEMLTLSLPKSDVFRSVSIKYSYQIMSTFKIMYLGYLFLFGISILSLWFSRKLLR